MNFSRPVTTKNNSVIYTSLINLYYYLNRYRNVLKNLGNIKFKNLDILITRNERTCVSIASVCNFLLKRRESCENFSRNVDNELIKTLK